MSIRIASGVRRAGEVAFTFEGAEVRAPAGETLLAALVAAGHLRLRSAPRDGAARGGFCAMGLCQECLVEVDGQRVEACRAEVAAGLVVRSVRYA
ncbi:MAG: (2Fe-2S)-binding protein [Pseudomonadota bacterium]